MIDIAGYTSQCHNNPLMCELSGSYSWLFVYIFSIYIFILMIYFFTAASHLISDLKADHLIALASAAAGTDHQRAHTHH